MNATLPRTRKPLQPASVAVQWLAAPVWPCEIIPAGIPGTVLLNGTPYAVLPLTEKHQEGF